MTELDFLNKLRRESRLKIVEPSDEVKKAYLQKSESYLTSAKLLLKPEERVSMVYYSRATVEDHTVQKLNRRGRKSILGAELEREDSVSNIIEWGERI